MTKRECAIVMALYKTIEQNKEMFAGLKGEDKILVKLLIRSLVP